MTSSVDIAAKFEQFVQSPEFPCVGAKSALARQNISIHVTADMRCPDVSRLYECIKTFGTTIDKSANTFQSLAVIFSGPIDLDEIGFEEMLWARMDSLCEMDKDRGYGWAPDVLSDPASPEYAFSIAEVPYFLVGLHPRASRAARRFSFPAVIFNSHDQFEALRENGLYGKMQKTIRNRDQELSGSINPMLSDHGNESPAKQYSGRAVGEWRCPVSPAW